MKISHRVGILFLLASTSFLVSFVGSDPLLELSQKISAEALSNGKAYSDLAELTQLGPRLSGSVGAAQAVEWAKAKMESYGFDRIWLQPVQVPSWTRGSVERALMRASSKERALDVAALGNSVGTPGLEAQVLEVHSLQEVQERSVEVRGKIIFYNRAMDPRLRDTFEAYAGAADQRTAGASQAARFGAVAVLVRSLTTLADDVHPHTGVVSYRAGVAQIPAAALSTRSANELSATLKQNAALRVRLELSAERHALVPSYNVIGEITGRELPREFVVVGGHLDSWDLGTGAHDDGAGVVQSIEVLRILKTLGLRPKRTVRAVLFMAEEFGGYGAREYARQARLNGERHIAATESDRGGFAPLGFAVQADGRVLEAVRRWSPYLEPVHASEFVEGESGLDVGYLNELGAATFGYIPESRHYFDYHHAATDQLAAVNVGELHAGAAAMAILTYFLAEFGI